MLKYGINRVLEPKYVLPTSAWKLDNSREIAPAEMRITIKRLHIETTSFKQICLEANNHDEQIKEKIMDIVLKRGKLHNPVTDTGGLLYGVVDEIGEDYNNEKNLQVGDEILCNTSLAGVPLYLNRIISVDKAYKQVEVEGYAIVFDKIPVVRKPEGVPLNLLLFIFNESGTLYRVSREIEGRKSFLVLGNNIMTNLMFGYVIRKKAGLDAEIICLFDKKTDLVIVGKSIDKLLSEVFDEVHYVNILRPIECLEKLNIDSRFDMTVNCADIPGAETINILATKSGGTVIFANFINNYNIALYITESISKHLELKCADGYLEKYDEFDIQVVRELAPYIENAVTSTAVFEEDLAYPLVREDRVLSSEGYRRSMAENFICESRAMAMVLEEILKVSKYDCNVLITGETGVGKDKIANIIQKNSVRNMQPFIKINCAAIAPNLMESEFFGYERGSFTGANTSGKKGYFESADNGIIFLDEVGELPLDIQAKLLRVTQDGELYRVGGTTPIKTNVRIISATNRNLLEQIDKKQFRQDLYYRLNVFPIRVPSLKERKAEIPALARHFVKTYNKKYGINRGIDEEAIEYLRERQWTGNIRELENSVQRILISAKGENITLIDVIKCLNDTAFEQIDFDSQEDLSERIGNDFTLEPLVESFEKNLLRYACEKYGSTRKTAQAIGISQTQLVRKKKKYGIT
ncbi:sigma-54 interaction domain-containing protein [Aminipila sp.]|uniref:sigma-54 interaction domain-containing protein n=1 Tax=Aminipila sp. TaxID=2060095 RepID=UPI002896CAAF|nr:sigma-54 dependent transcriptional regulator [Aminipila sp.]